MLSLVWERRPSYNNNPTITKSAVATYVKLIYYSVFALCYGISGSMANLVMVNSTWTLNHIKQLWCLCGDKKNIHVIFPPCDTSNFEDLPLANRENIIISIGQFRPEKDHPLQLRSFSLFRKNCNQSDVKLVLLGSCRDKEDQVRVDELRRLAMDLNISESVDFVLNQPFPVLKQWLGRASVGLHTMWNEHFGIGVVEMMSAGCITIAHRSGGPLTDIITHGKTGYLASTEDEYASLMADVFMGRVKNEYIIRTAARESARRFSAENFKKSFRQSLLTSNILVVS
jgi:alpha-1,2-mannosyltransferase